MRKLEVDTTGPDVDRVAVSGIDTVIDNRVRVRVTTRFPMISMRPMMVIELAAIWQGRMEARCN
jgi:hypothetical protein